LIAAVILLAPFRAEPQATPPSELRIDTTFAVESDVRVRVETASGRISIRGWDRSAIHIAAVARRGTTVMIQRGEATAAVWGRRGAGLFDEVDYEMHVPRRASLTLGTGDVDIVVDSIDGDIVARNYAGEIRMHQTRGTLSLKSTLGAITVRAARGPVTTEALQADVRLEQVTGDVTVRSTSNQIYLVDVTSNRISAQTVGGAIQFSGPIRRDGTYQFTSHQGAIILDVVGELDATLSVATVQGGFSSAFPTQMREQRRRGVFTTVAGTGAATLELETFSGGIVIRRAGTKKEE
jgi:DUF4097 and DUF4098 domain-containing protein YvlB